MTELSTKPWSLFICPGFDFGAALGTAVAISRAGGRWCPSPGGGGAAPPPAFIPSPALGKPYMIPLTDHWLRNTEPYPGATCLMSSNKSGKIKLVRLGQTTGGLLVNYSNLFEVIKCWRQISQCLATMSHLFANPFFWPFHSALEESANGSGSGEA